MRNKGKSDSISSASSSVLKGMEQWQVQFLCARARARERERERERERMNERELIRLSRFKIHSRFKGPGEPFREPWNNHGGCSRLATAMCFRRSISPSSWRPYV